MLFGLVGFGGVLGFGLGWWVCGGVVWVGVVWGCGFGFRVFRDEVMDLLARNVPIA